MWVTWTWYKYPLVSAIQLCSVMWWCKLKSLKYAHSQRCLKKGEVAGVMWSTEVQKNSTLSKQAIIGSLPADHRRVCFPYSSPPPTEQIPNPQAQRGLDNRSLQFFTPQSTKNLVINSPNAEKEITSFPFLSFPPSLQPAIGNSYRKGHVFPYYLTNIHSTLTMYQAPWGMLVMVKAEPCWTLTMYPAFL